MKIQDSNRAFRHSEKGVHFKILPVQVKLGKPQDGAKELNLRDVEYLQPQLCQVEQEVTEEELSSQPHHNSSGLQKRRDLLYHSHCDIFHLLREVARVTLEHRFQVLIYWILY